MMNPKYVNPHPVPAPDIYGAVYDFVKTYAFPALPPENIYRAWQHQAGQPPEASEYAIIAVLESAQRGTNVATLLDTGAGEDEPEIYQTRAYHECRVQVEFASDSDLGYRRAASLSAAASSNLGVAFFKDYGLTAQYAGPVEDASLNDESNQCANLYRVYLSLAYWAGVDVGSAWLSFDGQSAGIVIKRVTGKTSHPGPDRGDAPPRRP